MLRNEMQHQFWITKKTVQRKLGTKEDEYVISSDAELDAKIEIFKSISETITDLCKIIDQYQEHLCVLSQEESYFGKFLKEAGKRSNTTSQSISHAGKSVSYCGQQRMCVRVPLLRLQHEVEIFRNRAISDTYATITAMEKERTEYRAALEWMKSSSSELDPDTGRGVEKFRTAQSHVRHAKVNFDNLSMDCIQKIDLLAAARCNMFSHVLVSYMTDMKQFSQKTTAILVAMYKALENNPRYDFCVLKDLSQHEDSKSEVSATDSITLDNDQTLFFAFDFQDDHHIDPVDKTERESIEPSLLEFNKNDDVNLNVAKNKIDNTNYISAFNSMTSTVTSQQSFKKETNYVQAEASISSDERSNRSIDISKQSSWMALFAELDPLANLEAFDKKFTCNSKNSEKI